MEVVVDADPYKGEEERKVPIISNTFSEEAIIVSG